MSIAKQYCFDLGKFDSKLQETVFVGTPENLKAYVEAVAPDACSAVSKKQQCVLERHGLSDGTTSL
jgi:hypothetical protein